MIFASPKTHKAKIIDLFLRCGHEERTHALCLNLGCEFNGMQIESKGTTPFKRHILESHKGLFIKGQEFNRKLKAKKIKEIKN